MNRFLMAAWAALLINLAAVAPVQGHGPSFPPLLTADPEAYLAYLPEGNFDYEVTRLMENVPAYPRPARVDADDDYWSEKPEEPSPESIGLTTQEYEQVGAVRKAASLAEAESLAMPLALELRHYTLGAFRFHHKDFAGARAEFERVLALPLEQRKRRTLWASFSIGRTWLNPHEDRKDYRRWYGYAEMAPPAETVRDDLQKATLAFQRTRELAKENVEDTAALAWDSLNEEAMAWLMLGDWGQAIRLYFAARERVSVTMVTRELFRLEADRLSPMLDDELLGGLVCATLFSRATSNGWPYDNSDGGQAQLLQRLAANPKPLKCQDQLAAVAYHTGAFDLAASLVEKAGDSGTAWWVRAKLHNYRGDDAAALESYAEAARRFPTDLVWGSEWAVDGALKPVLHVQAEVAALKLHRQEYLDVFRNLYFSGKQYWPDASHVAERLLTIEELTTFVDSDEFRNSNGPERERLKVEYIEEYGEVLPLPEEDDYLDSQPTLHYYYLATNNADRLRALLARRLMRNDAWASAVAYFDDPEEKSLAERYASYRQAAEAAWTDIGSAEALYEAARLLREHGMVLLGTEMAPDFSIVDGTYDWRTHGVCEPEWGSGCVPGFPKSERDSASRAGVTDSGSAKDHPDRRYHYRYVASDLLAQAAELVPSTSQTYAALLCTASGWIEYLDPPTARHLYRRYVANGPYVPWAERFGWQCEAPRFDRAWRRVWLDPVDRLRAMVRGQGAG